MNAKIIRIGTRASELALAQAGMVAETLAAASGVEVELVPITSEGDRRTESLATIGGTGIFASALREALDAGECEILVHSLKDLPTSPYPGLTIGAVPEREDAHDSLCARDGMTLRTLPHGARVGTGSPRRVAQLKSLRPDLDVVDLRGNVGTRLSRVNADDLDAVVLAAAGLNRLGRSDVITQLLDLDNWPTAPGQGALGVEVRTDSLPELGGILDAINHEPTHIAAAAERAVLARLEAGCSAPVGTTATARGDSLSITATVYRADGTEQLTSSHSCTLHGAAADRMRVALELGAAVGDDLLKLGAAQLVLASRTREP